MIPIHTLLNSLQNVGVNYITSDSTIMLEILKDQPSKASEIDMLIHELITQLQNNHFKMIKLECPKQLLNLLHCTQAKMNVIGERVAFTNNLTMLDGFDVPNYEVWSTFDNSAIAFLSEVMQKSYIESENYLKQMREELPSQAEKMYTVYKVNNEPVGVVFPHIEPHTDREGRMFWIGMHPSFKEKRMGKALHAIGLYRLKNDFKAKSYLGITQIDNDAMKKIMIANGCMQHENTLISLEYFDE